MATTTSPRALGLAGSNELRILPDLRLACFTDAEIGDERPTQHIVIKRRLPKPIGKWGNHHYATDEALMQAADRFCRDHGYPRSPDDRGICRIPITLLGSDPGVTLNQRRVMRVGRNVECECSEWAHKSPEQCTAEKLDPLDDPGDDERYFIGQCTRYSFVKTERKLKDKTLTVSTPSGRTKAECNPHKCPSATGKDSRTGADRKGGKTCKPHTDILFALEGWIGSGTLRGMTHSEAWTNSHIRSTFFEVYRALGTALFGAVVDLRLQHVQRNTPVGASMVPMWSIEIPHGMTPDEFQEVTLARATERNERMARLLGASQENAKLMAGLNSIQEAFLGEWEPPLLGAGEEVAPVETTPLTQEEKDAAARLVRDHGFALAFAEATVRSNAGDLEAMFAKLGPAIPVEVGAPVEEPVLEGEVLPDEPPEDDEATDEPTDEEIAQAFADTEAAGQPVPVEPLFPTPPADFMQIRKRFVELGEELWFSTALGPMWHRQTGKFRQAVPMPRNCDPDLFDRLLSDMIAHAEAWWAERGASE